MDGAAKFEPPWPLRGKTNDGLLPWLEIGAFDASSVRNDSVSFDLSQVSLQHDGTKVVPDLILVHDRHHDRHAGHQRDAAGHEGGILDRHLHLLLGLTGRRRPCRTEKASE